MKMTKAQAKKRVKEGYMKFLKVFLYHPEFMNVADITAIEKIKDRIVKRMK